MQVTITYDNPIGRNYDRMVNALGAFGTLTVLGPRTTFKLIAYRGVTIRQVKLAISKILHPLRGSALISSPRHGSFQKDNKLGWSTPRWIKV